MPRASLWETLQKIATVVYRLDAVAQDIVALRTTIGTRLDNLEKQLGDMRERLARLEASRDADRTQIQAEISRFQSDVERAEFRLRRFLRLGKRRSHPSSRADIPYICG